MASLKTGLTALLMLAVLCTAVNADVPTFVWSGKSLFSVDFTANVKLNELQKFVSDVDKVSTNVVFVQDQLSTEDITRLAAKGKVVAFPQVKNVIDDAVSSHVFSRVSGSEHVGSSLSSTLSKVSQKPIVTLKGNDADLLEKVEKALATNVVVIQLPALAGASAKTAERTVAQNDALIAKVMTVVAKKTGGDYLAVLTAETSTVDNTQFEFVTVSETHDRNRREALPVDATQAYYASFVTCADYGYEYCFFTQGILMGLFTTFILLCVLCLGVCGLMSLQSPVRFENPKIAAGRAPPVTN
eukprot:Colp12_sorted_trinity150504_noHs@8966